jgi:hypothetical protein
VVNANTGKTLGKRKQLGSVANTHHSKWKSLEHECLIESWKAASLDPITVAPTKLLASTTQGFEMISTSAATLVSMQRFT